LTPGGRLPCRTGADTLAGMVDASDEGWRATSPAQLRAARALLELSREDVAAAAGVTAAAVAAAEDGEVGEAARLAIRQALEAAGIVFLAVGEAPDGGAGVRLRRTDEEDGLRPDELNAANDG
jgi:DNA-binding XRE family transcriptional regulator